MCNYDKGCRGRDGIKKEHYALFLFHLCFCNLYFEVGISLFLNSNSAIAKKIMVYTSDMPLNNNISLRNGGIKPGLVNVNGRYISHFNSFLNITIAKSTPLTMDDA